MQTAVDFYRENLSAMVSTGSTPYKTEPEIYEIAKEIEKQHKEEMYSKDEVIQIIKKSFTQGERYGWDSQKSIGNIDEMKSKIPFISLEEWLEIHKDLGITSSQTEISDKDIEPQSEFEQWLIDTNDMYRKAQLKKNKTLNV